MDGELETIKRVCCEAAITPRKIMILSVYSRFLQEQTLNLRFSLFYGQLLCRTGYTLRLSWFYKWFPSANSLQQPLMYGKLFYWGRTISTSQQILLYRSVLAISSCLCAFKAVGALNKPWLTCLVCSTRLSLFYLLPLIIEQTKPAIFL